MSYETQMLNMMSIFPMVNSATSSPKGEEKKVVFPKYKIIIWNDDHSVFEMVLKLLEVVFGFSEIEGFELTKKIHEEGNVIVWNGTYEVGELKIDQSKKFISEYEEYLKNLKITLEKE